MPRAANAGAARPRPSNFTWLIERILRSGVGILSEEYNMVYFPGDDLFAIHRPRGLPIGNLTSQLWANCFLNPLDHFIKRTLKCRGFFVSSTIPCRSEEHTSELQSR